MPENESQVGMTTMQICFRNSILANIDPTDAIVNPISKSRLPRRARRSEVYLSSKLAVRNGKRAEHACSTSLPKPEDEKWVRHFRPRSLPMVKYIVRRKPLASRATPPYALAVLCGVILICLVVFDKSSKLPQGVVPNAQLASQPRGGTHEAPLNAQQDGETHEGSGAAQLKSESNVATSTAQLPDWIDPYQPPAAGRPQWCKQLEDDPRPRPFMPLFGECGRKHNEVMCADGRPAFFGWKNEDLYTWKMHFRHLARPGTFLDVAANDPVSRSNTYFYEQCLGWKGVCVEANPAYFPPLRARRQCTLVKRCVSNKREEVVFADSGGVGGVLATNKNAAWANLKRTRTIQCIPTAEALSLLGQVNIDFMSLDVEGHELFVLQGIDWATTKINVIVTESQDEELASLLRQQGFRLHALQNASAPDALRGDRLFVHERVTWGRPV